MPSGINMEDPFICPTFKINISQRETFPIIYFLEFMNAIILSTNKCIRRLGIAALCSTRLNDDVDGNTHPLVLHSLQEKLFNLLSNNTNGLV